MKIIPVRHIVENNIEQLSSERFKIRKIQDVLDREDLFHELHGHDFFFTIALLKD
jgi:hypothetical protein